MTNLYCVKCGKRTGNQFEPKRVVTKNNRNMLKTKCKVCGTQKSQFAA